MAPLTLVFTNLLSLALLLPNTLAKHHRPNTPQISLQWAICDTNSTAVLTKLNHPTAQPYKSNPITYYDTWPPTHTPHGLALRTKVKHHDPGYPISMVKARFGAYQEHVPSQADCRWTRYGNATTYTCGLASPLSEIGGAEGERVWSPQQVDFAQRYGDVEWEDLVSFGPYVNPKWKLRLLGLKAVFDDVVALPLHLMEVEINIAEADGVETYERVSGYLRERGVVLCEEQLPKTLRLLKYLEDEAGGTREGRGSDQIVLG